MKIHQFERQRVVNREGGRIQSIKPTYQDEMNKYNTFYVLFEKLVLLSKDFPQEKFMIEINNTPEEQYEMIKADIGIGDNFTDHSEKFFYNVSVNAIIIVHKPY